MDMPRENWMGDMLTLAEWRAKLAAVHKGTKEHLALLAREPTEYRCAHCKVLLGLVEGHEVRWAPGSVGHLCQGAT